MDRRWLLGNRWLGRDSHQLGAGSHRPHWSGIGAALWWNRSAASGRDCLDIGHQNAGSEYVARSMSRLKFSRTEVAVSLLAVILLQLEVWLFDPGSPALARAAISLVAAGALAFQRTFPFGGYLVNGLAVYALIGIGYPSDYYQWTNFIALVVMASRSELGRSLLGLLLGFAGIAFYFIRFPEEGDGFLTAAFVMALYLAGWLVGRAQLSRTRLASQEAQSELVEERTRLARELHDIVGHAVNLMVVQAG